MAQTLSIHPVEALMRLYGWSTLKTADKAGMNRETLRRRLARGEEFSFPEVLALSYALDVPMEVLDMTGEEAIRWCLDQHNGWQAKRCLLPDGQRVPS